ncbi:hypothetical protein HHK36_026695 [Tetracentron sinense]|uniref:Phytocyanin domain-containing protein n=1 Tax=Tetracentron sinense TaxID=13715 RepID=A0A834YGG0_TETSI|nr:hypothetical protein HHK36_026695 [Tetracentron sinense]
MAFLQRAMVLFLVMAALRVSFATVYKVGDSAGWTTIGNVDYKKWASTKTFHVGDTVLFEYNSQFHNVMQVNHTDYKSCNITTPMATHSTGNDSIAISRTGHYYFLCGVPGHCQAGQKVDIRIARASSSVAPTPSVSPSPSSSSPSPSRVVAPATSQNNSAPSIPSMGLLGKLGMAMTVFAVCASGFVQ